MRVSGKLNGQIAFLSCLLLLIAATRILRLSAFDMSEDEVWSVWQTFGTPGQIIQWTPYDWAPFYYLSLGLWRALVGIHPIILRYLSTLFALIIASLIYRIGKQLTGSFWGGALALLSYATMGYGIFQGVVTRGYTLLTMLSTFAFLLTLRYFEQPTLRRGIMLGIVLAGMIYTHFSAVFAFAAFGIYTLIVMPRYIHRWLLPVSVLFILNIPQMPKQIDFLFGEANFSIKPTPLPILTNLLLLFKDFAGYAWIILLIALVIATFAFARHHQVSRKMMAFGVWMLAPAWLYLVPSSLYFFTDPVNGTFLPRYLWWLILPFAVWICLGVVRMHRTIIYSVVILLAAATLLPVPQYYQTSDTPFISYFSQFADTAKWGDVLLIDPSLSHVDSMEWQYFSNVYFPKGIRIVDHPVDFRRVWYATVNGQQNHDLFEALQSNRVAGKYFGPPTFLIRLYEAAPDSTGIAFANGMRFHGAEIIDAPDPPAVVFRTGETIRIRIWWSVDETPALDYSVGVYLFDAQSTLLFESNSAPAVPDTPLETSRWETGRYYIEERGIVLPQNAVSGTYSLYLALYQWWDRQRITAEGLTDDLLLPLPQFEIKSWWFP